MPTPEVRELEHLFGQSLLLVGDIVLCEVLAGARNERELALIEGTFGQLVIVSMLDAFLARAAAGHYRRLRAHGIRPRSVADLIIGTFCIEGRHVLLHSDRDFDHMEEHLRLEVVRVGRMVKEDAAPYAVAA